MTFNKKSDEKTLFLYIHYIETLKLIFVSLNSSIIFTSIFLTNALETFVMSLKLVSITIL